MAYTQSAAERRRMNVKRVRFLSAVPLPSATPARRLALGAITLLLLLALVSIAPASAAVREGTVTGTAPWNPPSLGPAPLASEQAPYAERVTVAYDDQTGRLSATVRLFSPQFWGTRLPTVTIVFGTTGCGADYDDRAVVRESNAKMTLRMDSGADLVTYATRAEYASHADGTLTFDGSTFTATVTNPGLAGVEARCFLVKELGATPVEGSWLHSGELSYAPMELNRSIAERAMRAALSSRFGAAWRTASPRYLKCAPNYDADDDGANRAGCEGQFGGGRNWTFVAWRARVAAGDYRVATEGKPYVYRWTRRWRRSSAACLRSWHIKGALWSNVDGCSAHLASNLYRGVMYSGGANTGDFDSMFRYPCRHHGRVLQCTNALGDSVRWRR